jgi:(p)ppGpp synthase/HD superfamily hydrolase
MPSVERAIAIAAEAHAGQVDKAGAPYILHPLRVMLAQTSAEARMAAVLHDVVEDCPGWTLDRLRGEGFSDLVLEAIAAVTKRPEERDDYEAFIRRAARHPIGRLVKRADLRDNLDLSRIAEPSAKDLKRADKYRRALLLLDGPSGSPGLGRDA